MDNVIGHVVFTGRDKDLLAGHFVGPVVLWFRFGPHQSQIGAAMWFGQVHGSCPFAGSHICQVSCFLRFRAMGKNGGCRTVGQPLIHGEGLVRRAEHLTNGGVDDVRHVLAAEFLGHVERGPAAFLHLIERGLKARWCAHNAVFQHATFGIAHDVQRVQDLGCDFAGFFENGVCEIRFEFIIAADTGLCDLQNFMQDELCVFGGGCIAGHLLLSLSERGLKCGEAVCGLRFTRGLLCGFVLIFHRGEDLLSPLDLLFELINGGREFVSLAFHVCKTIKSDLIGAAQLRMLLISDMVHIQKLPDFFEAEAKALAAQDELQPGLITFGKKSFLTLSDREQKLFRFIEA